MADALDNLQCLTTLTVDNATAALEQGLDAIKAGQAVFNLRNVKAVDSAAVSVMLAWQRAAEQAGVPLQLKNLPPNLKSLTKLYGVCSLLSNTLAEAEAKVEAQAEAQAEADAGNPGDTGAAELHHH